MGLKVDELLKMLNGTEPRTCPFCKTGANCGHTEEWVTERLQSAAQTLQTRAEALVQEMVQSNTHPTLRLAAALEAALVQVWLLGMVVRAGGNELDPADQIMRDTTMAVALSDLTMPQRIGVVQHALTIDGMILWQRLLLSAEGEKNIAVN